MTQLDRLNTVWDAWREMEHEPKIVLGIDPGWDGGYALVAQNGEFLEVGGWTYRDWSCLANFVNTIVQLATVDESSVVFAAIEGTHHYGKATKDDIASLNRKIGMWVQEIKNGAGYICCIPPVRKVKPETICNKYATYGLGQDDHTAVRTQHESDACEIAHKMWRIMTSAVRPSISTNRKTRGHKSCRGTKSRIPGEPSRFGF